MDGVAIAQNIMSTSLHQEIRRITDTEEHAVGNSCSRGVFSKLPGPVLAAPLQ